MIGRESEIRKLEMAYDSDESEFVAVYGRRRVGKTFLVRETFNDRFAFQHAGLAHAGHKRQLARFRQSLAEYGFETTRALADWDAAFDALKHVILKSTSPRKVVFIDEMPWMDTPRSGFITALESFWNSWASARKDIVLIVCGSAASWIVKNLFRNKGGLHNRVTLRIHLNPFSLHECEEFAADKGLHMSRTDLVECYMALGGIPFYWKCLDRRLSLAQNLDAIFFADGAPLRYEFDELYASLFGKSGLYRNIVSALATGRRSGLSRLELCDALKVNGSGKLTQALQVLEQCGFIRFYNQPGTRKKGAIIQLMDALTLFHFRFLAGSTHPDEHAWTLQQNQPALSNWRGLAFERVCLQHLEQIRAALGISGVHLEAYAWTHQPDKLCPHGAQIDLVLDRSDHVVNLCEMKFTRGPFLITKSVASDIRRKLTAYEATEGRNRSLHVTFVTIEGIVHNEYRNLVQSEVMLNDLFRA